MTLVERTLFILSTHPDIIYPSYSLVYDVLSTRTIGDKIYIARQWAKKNIRNIRLVTLYCRRADLPISIVDPRNMYLKTTLPINKHIKYLAQVGTKVEDMYPQLRIATDLSNLIYWLDRPITTSQEEEFLKIGGIYEI